MTARLATNRLQNLNERIIGQSQLIISLRDLIAKVSHSTVSVIIGGPSGSGKEMAARAIHEFGPRSNGPFVAVNCGAVPGDLIESELFGHERGAFTGAISRRIGRFEEADGGTLFLDEIGDMRSDMQVKLLRILEDKMVSRIGANSSFPVNVRVIAASHQDLPMAVREKRFREDLYFRLAVMNLEMPSLKERIEDIPILFAHLLKQTTNAAHTKFSGQAIEVLKSHTWPGNVRELRNVAQRACALFEGEVVDSADMARLIGLNYKPVMEKIATDLASQPSKSPSVVSASCNYQQSDSHTRNMPIELCVPINLKEFVEKIEQDRIFAALEAAQGVVSEAARLLTLKRTTLIEKMRKYGASPIAPSHCRIEVHKQFGGQVTLQ
jgi:sigma-54 dependent transcriptional regulator, flagellar regulatory protein